MQDGDTISRDRLLAGLVEEIEPAVGDRVGELCTRSRMRIPKRDSTPHRRTGRGAALQTSDGVGRQGLEP